MRSSRTWLAAAVVAYAAVDVVRRFFGAERWFLLVVDALLLATLATYLFHEYRRIPVGRRGSQAVLALGVAATVVVLGALNPWWIDVTTTLAGLRSYLLPMPFLLVGYHAASTWTGAERLAASRFLLVVAGAAIAGAFVQLATDYQALTGAAALLLTPLEHTVHSFGDEAVQLTSSFFASSKRFGRFLLFSFALVWAFRREAGRATWPFYALFLAGVAASGSREAFVLLLAFGGATWALFGRYRAVGVWAAAAVAVAALWVTLADVTYAGGPPGGSRFDFLLSASDPSEYGRRVRMLFPLDRIDLSAERILLGHGLGKYGQEALLVPEIYAATGALAPGLFRPLPFFGPAYDFGDAGMTKTIVEVGVVGTLLLIAALAVLLGMAAVAAVRGVRAGQPAPFATTAVAFAWLLMAAKGHPVLSDAMAGVAFYFCLGFGVRALDGPPARATADAAPAAGAAAHGEALPA